MLTQRSQIYLGMEQREASADSKAMKLIDEFSAKFRNISYTVHPSDLPGESAGKGSNVAWAARKLSEKYPIEQRRNVVVTGIDGKFSQIRPATSLSPGQLVVDGKAAIGRCELDERTRFADLLHYSR